jgi:manganese transport protein
MTPPVHAPTAPSLSRHTTNAMRDVLEGRRSGWSRLAHFAGPAVIVSVAYMDPGNFATNIQAGARYGYALLWVVLVANLVAMLFQSLSARLGIVTGCSLAQLCRTHFPKPVVYVMWAISEVAAMATDLAEFLGGAIGLALLFHLPLLVGMGIMAVITFAILHFDKAGFRPLELVIGALVGVIGLSYLAEVLIAPVDWPSVGLHLFKPDLPDARAVTIAVGIIGATVMPHALFLHSGLTQHRIEPRDDNERKTLIRYSNLEVMIALTVAGLINIAMVIMAASAFHAGHPEVARIETAYHTLVPLLGAAAAGLFLLSLIASGVSSSVVGTMAGQMIMDGFVGFKIPLWARRAITMIPSFVVVAMGIDATEALVASQVVLSIALPVPMLALLWFTSRRDLMGHYTNGTLVKVGAGIAGALVLSLNGILLLQAFDISLPGLPAA